MILLLTHRRLVKEIFSMVWSGANGKYKFQRCVPFNDLEGELFGKQFFPNNWKVKTLLKVMNWFNKDSGDFSLRVEDIVEHCIKEGYLEKDATNCIKVSWKGERFISSWYWIKDFTKHPLILEVIKYGLPVAAVWSIITNLISKINN